MAIHLAVFVGSEVSGVSKITNSVVGISDCLVISHKNHQIPAIYLITCVVNGKVYVGQTNNLYKRYKHHESSSRTKDLYNRPLVRAFNKYGFNNFKFSILETPEKEMLTVREQFWMDFYKSSKNEFGYNACPAANSTLGYKHSLETRKKVSKASKGRLHSEETRILMSKIHKGKVNSDESKIKNRMAHLGKKLGDVKGKAVKQISKEDGQVINIFISASQAVRELGLTSFSIILEAARGKRKSAFGYIWRFA